MALTQKQSDILKAIIEEHIECAQPIASVELVEKRSLTISGATVRNVMAELVRMGYLQMLHVSSGRMPTDRAYRYYISELMEEPDVSVLDEVSIKQKMWSNRYEVERLLTSAVYTLSDLTDLLSIAITIDGFITHAGSSKLLALPEFHEIDVVRAVLRLTDDYELTKSIFELGGEHDDLSVLIGREIGLANMDPVSFVSSFCKLGRNDCYVGLVGPARMRYDKVIPTIKYTASLINEIGENL